ncbi:frataxin homolog, mitochondrial [Battus philenor]|uniref:frataxin homolog, mitochondrial n=1 Tax=Battus philenor TaxID=42288 RepID=UPI0035CF0C60
MFRSILRTSRWLVRRQINNFTPVLLNQRTFANVFNSSYVFLSQKSFSTNTSSTSQPSQIVDPLVFEEICNETLESLCEYFEEILERTSNLQGADVTFSDGVLTIALGPEHGTYVINRQSPNKQIWLSSPISGPKRYDLILQEGGYWVYKHDGVTLHKLLQEEISKLLKTKVDFRICAHSML